MNNEQLNTLKAKYQDTGNDAQLKEAFEMGVKSVDTDIIKADAVRGILDLAYDCETPNGDSAHSQTTIEDHANKLEQGDYDK